MTKKQADLLIINASELLTLNGPKRARRGRELRALAIIKEGAVSIRAGKIEAAGNTGEILKRYEAKKNNILDAAGKTVMPGFVDAHTHLIFAGSRENELLMKLDGKSYMEILEAGGGILNTVKATRNATKKQLVAEAVGRLDRMLLHGTTSLEAKTGYGLTLKDELKSLEALETLQRNHSCDIVPTFLGAHAIPPEYNDKCKDKRNHKNPDGYVDLIIGKMLPKVKKRAAFCDVFCEDGAFSIEQSRKILKAAQDYGMGLKLHADEFADTGGAALAAELKATSAEHLLRSNRDGIRKMAKSGVIGVLLPAAAFSLMGNRYADARYMVESGLPIALGTDLCPNSWTESMQFVVRLACYNMKLTPAEAISAATINSAYAIGTGSDAGSIEAGKKADIIILNAPNHLHIAYRLGVNLVEKVVKSGKVVA